MPLTKSDVLKSIGNYVKNTLITILLLIVGWLAHQIYTNLNKESVIFKTTNDVSTAIDERGRLHIVDLETQLTTIYQDTVSLAINSQISSQIYSDYIKKTEQDKKSKK